MNLVNRTDILYKSLTIPCCEKCNRVHLSQIENKVKKAVNAGFDAVEKLDPLMLYLWMGKIFYGLMYLEHLLPADRKRKSRPILQRDVMEELEIHHLYLQGARKPLKCPFGIPGSLFLFRTSVPRTRELQFDFFDNVQLRCMAIRMGPIGLICVFHDGGIVKCCLGEEYRARTLHPIQFRELVARIVHKTLLLEASPSFLLVESQHEIQVLVTVPPNISFREWKTEDYCFHLAFLLGQNLNELFRPPDEFISYLEEPDGTFRELDPDTRYVFELSQ